MMKRILFSMLPLILLFSFSAIAQQNLTLIVAGQPGQAPIVQINGKSYVDIDALARLTNSSVSFKGNKVILTPVGSAPSTLAAKPEPSASAGQLKLVAERQPVDTEPSASTGQLELVAERQPVDPEPSEPAAQAKPVADAPKPDAESEAARTAALAKAAQNPVADMISFPMQNNTNFGVGPNQRVQDVLNFQPVIPLHLNAEVEPDHPHHPARRLAAQCGAAQRPGLVRPRRLESQPLLLSRQVRQTDLGRGTGDGFPHRNRATVRTGKSQRGPRRRRPHYSGSLGHRRSGQQCLVVCRYAAAVRRSINSCCSTSLTTT